MFFKKCVSIICIMSAILMPLLSAIPAYAAGDQVQCGRCQPISSQAPKPTTVKLVCFPFIQPKPAQVKIFFYDGQGNTLLHHGNTLYQHAKQAGTSDSFCVGAQRLVGVTQVVICNDHTALLNEEQVAEARTRGGLPRGATMCLFGDACASMK